MIHFHSTNSVLIIGFYIRYDLYIPVYIRLLQNSASLWFFPFSLCSLLYIRWEISIPLLLT